MQRTKLEIQESILDYVGDSENSHTHDPVLILGQLDFGPSSVKEVSSMVRSPMRKTLAATFVILVLLLPVAISIWADEDPQETQAVQIPVLQNDGGKSQEIPLMAPPTPTKPPVDPTYIYFSQAGLVTSEAILTAMKKTRLGNSEIAVASIVGRTFASYGLSTQPCWYVTGVGPTHYIAVGKNTLNDYHQPVETAKSAKGDLVRIDTGAALGGVCSDVARTFPVNRTFSDRQREIYAIVLAALKAGEQSALVGGATLGSIRDVMHGVLRDNGLQQYALDATQLGHYIGFGTDIHGEYSLPWSGKFNLPLQPKMVFALEPAVAMTNEGFGVRIEDMYMVNSSGVLVRLSASCPREVSEIEYIRGRMSGPIITSAPFLDEDQ